MRLHRYLVITVRLLNIKERSCDNELIFRTVYVLSCACLFVCLYINIEPIVNRLKRAV